MLLEICLLGMKFEYTVSMLPLINLIVFFFQLDFQFPLTILMVLKVHLDPRRFLPVNKLRTSSLSQIRTDNLISCDLISPN